MDNLAAGFAFGLGSDEFGAMDFQASMASDGDAASSSLMGAYTPFSPSMSRESVFPQGNLVGPRSSGIDLPRFPLVSYAQTLPMSGANFNPMMSPRHAFSGSGLSGISGYGTMFPPHMSPGDGRMSEGRSSGLVDSITEQLPSFSSMIGEAGPPSSSAANNIMPSSMPVFPTTPSSMMHVPMATPHDPTQAPAPGSGKHMDMSGENKSSVSSSVQTQSHHTSVQSFPGQMSHLSQEHTQNTEHSVSHADAQSECKTFVGTEDLQAHAISYNAVTPMQQRRRQSPRRAAAMAAQAAAASAAAELAIQTKQVQIPQASGMSPHAASFPRSPRGNTAVYDALSQHGYVNGHTMDLNGSGRRRSTGCNTESTIFPGQLPLSAASFPRRRTKVPFYKAGRFGVREPEVFECQTKKVPQITESVQTGLDVIEEQLPEPQRSLFPVNHNSCDVDPTDGKGGFPIRNSYNQNFNKKSVHEDENEAFKSYIEGDGYTKRGNSKTVVSPSFGEAAARAVMTTSVGDSATVVTVAIMSRQNSMGKSKSPVSMVSPGGGFDVSRTSDDLKENVKNASPYGGSRVQTRRGGRRSSPVLNLPTMVQTSQRGRTLRRRVSPDNISLENDEDFERLMEERKEKARAAEQERMEISIRIDDSQCVSYGEQKRWQCDLCDKSYTTKHNLVMHMLDHNGIKPHLCLVCGKYFKQLSHLNTHMLTHDKVRPHVCKVCGKNFTQISHLKRHQAVHQESKPYSCDECGRGFCFPSELRIHKERHQQGIFQVDHTCDDCGEEFTSAAVLKQHMLIHENRDDLCCRFCGRKFRYPSQLKDHIVIHSGSRPYICMECGMDFMKEHHLRAHQFTHTGLRPYSCPDCGRAFNQRANMLRHRLIHKAERSYKCEYCGKTFTQPQTLKAHMVVHADHKPYKCNQCGKEFGRLHNLHGHMHMHSDSKPYVCFCGSSFTLKGNLNRHKKVKHGLNESTESMEEEAVNFLSSLSERFREERSGDDTMDGMEVNGFEADGLSGDKGSSRKQRKSTPRKIPRQSSGGARKDSGGEGREDDEEEEFEEEEEEEDGSQAHQVTSLHFQALTDEAARPGTVMENGNHELLPDNSEEVNLEEMTAVKRSRRDRSHQRNLAQNEDFVPGLSDSDDKDDKDDGLHDEHDDEWMPRKKYGKGSKLDSLIAEKFKSS